MAVTRSDLATYLGATLGELIAAVGLEAVDQAGDLKEPIDAALRLYGTDRADRATATVPDADGDAIEALATVATLTRLEEAAGALFDVGVRGDSFRLSQLRQAIRDRLAAARADSLVAAYLGGGWRTGAIGFGFTEPDEDAA